MLIKNLSIFVFCLILFGSVGYVFADSPTEDDFVLPNGSLKKIIYLYPRIFDEDSSKYSNFIFTDYPNYLQVETMHGSIQLNKTTCAFNYFPSGYINSTSSIPLFTDQILVQIANDGTDNWSLLDSVNNASCSYFWDGKQLSGTRSVSGVGSLEYKYILSGNTWKTQLEPINLSTATNKKLGTLQYVDLYRDSIKFGGIVRDLDQLNGTTLSKTFLENNQGNVIDLLNGQYFDFDLGFNYLDNIRILDTGNNSSRLIFDYKSDHVIMPNEKLTIDPNFGDITVNVDKSVNDNNNDGLCDTGTGIISDGTASHSYYYGSASTEDCLVSFTEFNISNLPFNAEITSVHWHPTVQSVLSTINHDINAITSTQPSTVSDVATLFSLIDDGSSYIDATSISSTGTKDFDLGSTAVSDLQNAVDTSKGWFAVGIAPDDAVTQTASTQGIVYYSSSGTTPSTLSITYNLSPSSPKLFSINDDGHLQWFDGANNGYPITNSKLEYYDTTTSSWITLLTANQNYYDYTISSSETKKFRVSQENSLGYGCTQFTMDQDILQYLNVFFPFCYTLTNNGNQILDVDPTVYSAELYENNTKIGFDFSGINFIDTIGDINDFNFLHNGSKSSTAFWIKRDAVGSLTGTQVLIETVSGGGTSQVGFYATIANSAGTLEFTVNRGVLGTHAIDCYEPNLLPADSTWHFIVFTLDPTLASSNGVIYDNGVSVATCNNSASYSTSNQQISMNIGDYEAGADGDYTFVGQMKNMMFFKDKVLTQSEIQDIYNEQVTLSPYTKSSPYNDGVFSLTWNTITDPIIVDSNDDGYADAIYTVSQNSTDANFTKVMGIGIDSISIHTAGSGTYDEYFYNSDRNWIYVASGGDNGVTCYSKLGGFDILTGDYVQGLFTSSYNAGDGTTASMTGLLATTGDNGDHVLFSACKQSVHSRILIKSDSGTLKDTTVASVDSFYYTSSMFGMSSDQFYDTELNGYPITAITTSAGNCENDDCLVVDSTHSQLLSSSLTDYDFNPISFDPSIQLYTWGLQFPNSEIPTYNSYWKDYLPSILSKKSQEVALLNYKLLDPTSTKQFHTFLWDDSANNYVMYMRDNVLYYADYSNFLNRAIGYYHVDTDPPIFNSLTTSSSLTGYSYDLITPSSTSTISTAGVTALYSGTTIKPDTLIDRVIDPDVTNTNIIYPYIVGPTTGLSTLTVQIKNAPSSSAIAFKDDLYTLNGQQYVWQFDYTEADKTSTVDLPTSRCVDVYLKDLSVSSGTWDSLGNICASGSMPKTIVYLSELSFTFWSLPYGVSHTFNDTSTYLTTHVRHDTAPYDYNVKIYDASNVLQYNQNFTGSSSDIDTRNINATGIDLPAMLKVYDENGNQIYYATIGTPSYFSGPVAWFSEWLTIDGFNILFMLPIIFGAMFTRNTVGIGTMVTVVFIASLTWLGILPLPDIVIYFLVIIGIIGMVAYKKLYD